LIAANASPKLFVRAGAIARVRTDEKGRPIIEPVTDAALRGAVSRSANFYFRTDDKVRHVSPPLDVTRDILARGEWGLPELEAVVESPVLRPDGTVLTEPGYDAALRVVYHRAHSLGVPPIPDVPTDGQVAAAMAVIGEAIGQFPFASAADYANALGVLLTPFVRHALPGQVPLAVIEAPRAGTGKGLLACVIAGMATGHPLAMMSAPRDDAEMCKQITSVLLKGATVVCLDNVEGRLDSPGLSRALTARVWSDRILRGNQQPELPQRATWIATGNNITLGGDVPRRSIRIRLDAKVIQP
jgi:hypothetical protein